MPVREAGSWAICRNGTSLIFTQAKTTPKLAQDLEWFETEAQSFAADYEGKLADLSAADLLKSIQRSEKMDNIAGRIMSYAGLRYYQKTTDAARAKFMSDNQERIINAPPRWCFTGSNSTRFPMRPIPPH